MTSESFPIFDGHNDTLLNLYLPKRGHGRSFFEKSSTGHIDLPRARQANFAGGMFAIYIPTPNVKMDSYDDLKVQVDHVYARNMTEAVMAELFSLEVESAGQIKIIRSANQLQECLEKGVLSVVLHFEGAETIDAELTLLEKFYHKGLRSLGITWSRPNDFGFGVVPNHPSSYGPGLSEAGKRLVKECNRLGIVVDLSHLNQPGFWDVADISDAPLVATHSCASKLCDSSRNLTDDQLRAIAASDGLVGINFYVGFLCDDNHDNADTPIAAIADHIDYIAELIGAEHVAIGSDFDGATIPAEMKDVTGLTALVEILKDRGYHRGELEKITYENWFRVLGQTWK